MSRSRTRRDKGRRGTPEPKSNGSAPLAAVAEPDSSPEVQAPPKRDIASLLEGLAGHGIAAELAEGADEDTARPVLEKLLAAQEEEGADLVALVREAKAAGILIPEAENPPEEEEVADAELLDEEEVPGPVPTFDPLALWIQTTEAALHEAKAGYIAARVEALEEGVQQTFHPEAKQRLAELAFALRDATGLPDVPAAYRTLLLQQD